jgi:uncharacterized protein
LFIFEEKEVMLKYVAIILVEIIFWWRLRQDFPDKSVRSWKYVRFIKILLTILLLYAFGMLLFMKGDIALPMNAFTEIFFGAVAAMTIAAGGFYMLFSLVRLALVKIFKKELNWLRWTTLCFTSIIILLFVQGYYSGRFNTRIEKKDITIDSEGQDIEGLKIAFISDLHISSFYNHYNVLADAISEINISRPDLLINTGDFVSYGWQELSGLDTLLRKARPLIGSYAISGNHDDCSYDTHLDSGEQAEGRILTDSLIRASGYTLLNDSSVIVKYKNARVKLVGITTRGHRFHISYGNADNAFKETPDSSFVIFLVHDPSYWANDKRIAKKAPLTLSGHTHGMQIGVGKWSPAEYFYKYWSGLYQVDGRYLYVNRGLGTMSMAIRIFSPPEITIITLHNKK